MKLFQTAPFPYYGGKSQVASLIWRLIGPDVRHFVDPMMGSLSVLLARPPEYVTVKNIETVNDRNGLLVNFWRAVRADPEQVAYYVAWPVSHVDLVARRIAVKEWIQDDVHLERMMVDEDYYDPRIAGFWLYVANLAIGPVDNSLSGPWWREGEHLVYRKGERNGVTITAPHATRLHKAISIAARNNITKWLSMLQQRIQHVRILCDSWDRALYRALQTKVYNEPIPTGIFLDPPYNLDLLSSSSLYAYHEQETFFSVLNWCKQNGNVSHYRIVFATYKDEYTDELLSLGWREYPWYRRNSNAKGVARNERTLAIRNLERLYASPYCNVVENT